MIGGTAYEKALVGFVGFNRSDLKRGMDGIVYEFLEIIVLAEIKDKQYSS